MAGGSGIGTGDSRSLKDTPTWAVAIVCAVFVIISVLIEHGIHSLGTWFHKRHKKAMIEALEKIKSELMLLGFISLLITGFSQPISKICISSKFGDIMLPCKKPVQTAAGGVAGEFQTRKLTWFHEDTRRILAGGGGSGPDYCSKNNKVALISLTAINQLHIFIFVLAIFHVLYSGITIGLANAKLKRWKAWEKEATSLQYQFTSDASEFRFVHQTTFVKQHSGLSKMPVIRWIVAFFRQFFASVNKVDYLTLRHGFINVRNASAFWAHFAANDKFDFHKYIKRSMQDDFKVVVGISIPLWTFAIIFQLLNVYAWYMLFALSFLPPVLLFTIGAKLEMIITEMAQEIQDRSTVVKGRPLVEPNNKYFWFNRPHFILGLIHFTLFQNAFEMAYFLFTWYQFGLTSCFHENLAAILGRIALGLACQILCSYITFPLYALVTQMGSHMKKAIFEEQTTKALMKWRNAAKEKSRLNRTGQKSSLSGLVSGETTPSGGSSPLHLLHKYKNSKSDDIESIFSSPSPREYPEAQLGPHVGNHNPLPNHVFEITENNSEEFSFSKSITR